MLKIISEAIHKAIDEAPFQVRIEKGQYQVFNKTASNGGLVVFQSPLHDQAEDMMDAFNDTWIARKTVEIMRDLNIPFHTVYDKACWFGIMEGILAGE